MRRKKKKQKEAKPVTITGYSSKYTIVPADFKQPLFWQDFCKRFESFADQALNKMKNLDEFLDDYMDALIDEKYQEALGDASTQEAEHQYSIEKIMLEDETNIALLSAKKISATEELKKVTEDLRYNETIFEKYNLLEEDRRVFRGRTNEVSGHEEKPA